MNCFTTKLFKNSLKTKFRNGLSGLARRLICHDCHKKKRQRKCNYTQVLLLSEVHLFFTESARTAGAEKTEQTKIQQEYHNVSDKAGSKFSIIVLLLILVHPFIYRNMKALEPERSQSRLNIKPHLSRQQTRDNTPLLCLITHPSPTLFITGTFNQREQFFFCFVLKDRFFWHLNAFN